MTNLSNLLGKTIKAKNLPNGNSKDGKPAEHGSILIACLIILSVMTVYGAVLISVVYERSLGVSLSMDRTEALYLAEAGLAQALHEIKLLEDQDGDGIGTLPRKPLGHGVYFATHDPANLAITAIGEVNGVQRKVRIQYSGV